MAADLVTRRTALKFAGYITLLAHGWRGFPGQAATLPAEGYGTDPDLLKRTVTWARTLNPSQLAMLADLCDIVLPAEPPHPSAAALRVHEFLDEWISAPYPQMQADRAVILNGLAALDDATRHELHVPFTEADSSQQATMFDHLCSAAATAGFSRRVIELVCAGYYTTREGHAAIGYVGNVALTSFSGPPPDVVRHLDEALSQLVRAATHNG
jgi:hypothetical protein